MTLLWFIGDQAIIITTWQIYGKTLFLQSIYWGKRAKARKRLDRKCPPVRLSINGESYVR